MSHLPSFPLDRLWKGDRLDKMAVRQTSSMVRVYQNTLVPNVRKAAPVFRRLPAGTD